jgi:hypothetical protein
VTVALCRGGLGRCTQDRSCARRHDDGSVWMMFGDRLINPVLIVIAVGGEGTDGIGDLVEKRINHRTIIDFFLAHFDGDDLAAGGIDAVCSLRHERRRDVPCFSTSHSPAPPSFRPVLSTSR